jgi:hypothetical protein
MPRVAVRETQTPLACDRCCLMGTHKNVIASILALTSLFLVVCSQELREKHQCGCVLASTNQNVTCPNTTQPDICWLCPPGTNASLACLSSCPWGSCPALNACQACPVGASWLCGNARATWSFLFFFFFFFFCFCWYPLILT